MKGAERYGVCVVLEVSANKLISVLQTLQSSRLNVHSRTRPQPGALWPVNNLEWLVKSDFGSFIRKTNVLS